LSQDSETSSKSPETGDLNILDFIKKLRDSDELRHLPARLDFDYIRLTLQCNKICHKIDVAQEASVGLPARLTHEVEPAKEAAHWKSPTSWGCTIVSTILSEMDQFHLLKKQSGKKMKDAECDDPRVVAAIKVVQEFLDELKRVEVEAARKMAKAKEKRKETQAKKAEKAEQAKKVGEVKKQEHYVGGVR
jgi:hypothetical protein